MYCEVRGNMIAVNGQRCEEALLEGVVVDEFAVMKGCFIEVLNIEVV